MRPGSERTTFWRDRATGGLELLHATYVTHTFARHTHSTYAIGVIECGAETFLRGRDRFVAPAGSVVLINPEEPHTGETVTPAGWTYRMLYPEPAILAQVSSQLAGRPRDAPRFPSAVVQDRPLAASLLLLHRTLEGPASALARQEALLVALALLIERHASDAPRACQPRFEHRAVAIVRDYIAACYQRAITLTDLAGVTGLSPYHLVRTFRAAVGLPPHAYLTQVRIAHARAALAAGFPIAQVAAETGFADQSHFTRTFVRIAGVPPGVWARGDAADLASRASTPVG